MPALEQALIALFQWDGDSAPTIVVGQGSRVAPITPRRFVVAQDSKRGGRQGLGFIGDKSMASMLESDLFDADGRAHDRSGGGHRLEHLDPGPPAEPYRCNDDARPLELEEEIRDETENRHTARYRGCLMNGPKRAWTGDAQLGRRLFGNDTRPGLTDVTPQSRGIRRPQVAAEEEHSWFCGRLGGNGEELVVHAIRNYDGCVRPKTLEVATIVPRDTDDKICPTGRAPLRRQQASSAISAPEAFRVAGELPPTRRLHGRINVVRRYDGRNVPWRSGDVLHRPDLLELSDHGRSGQLVEASSEQRRIAIHLLPYVLAQPRGYGLRRVRDVFQPPAARLDLGPRWFFVLGQKTMRNEYVWSGTGTFDRLEQPGGAFPPAGGHRERCSAAEDDGGAALDGNNAVCC